MSVVGDDNTAMAYLKGQTSGLFGIGGVASQIEKVIQHQISHALRGMREREWVEPGEYYWTAPEDLPIVATINGIDYGEMLATGCGAGGSGAAHGSQPAGGGGGGDCIIDMPLLVIPGKTYKITIGEGAPAVRTETMAVSDFALGISGGATIIEDVVTLLGGQGGGVGANSGGAPGGPGGGRGGGETFTNSGGGSYGSAGIGVGMGEAGLGSPPAGFGSGGEVYPTCRGIGGVPLFGGGSITFTNSGSGGTGAGGAGTTNSQRLPSGPGGPGYLKIKY